MVERYASGSSLYPTTKEEDIDRLEGMLAAEFTDEFAVALKKFTREELKQLHKYIAEKIHDVYEECGK